MHPWEAIITFLMTPIYCSVIVAIGAGAFYGCEAVLYLLMSKLTGTARTISSSFWCLFPIMFFGLLWYLMHKFYIIPEILKEQVKGLTGFQMSDLAKIFFSLWFVYGIVLSCILFYFLFKKERV